MNEKNQTARLADMKHVIVGLGEILWDLLPEGRKLGGAPANFAYHAGALGAEGIPVSRIGCDELGAEIIAGLEDSGLCTDYIQHDKAHPTGTVTVKLSEDGIPEYTIHEDVAWDFIEASPKFLDLAAKADAVCFGTLAQRSPASRKSIRAFLAGTKAGALKIFDINFRQSYYQRETIVLSLSSSNVFKINDDELHVMAEMFGYPDGAEEFALVLQKTFNLRLVAITMGGKGSVLIGEGGRKSVHPGFPAKVADTVGAGDSFTAAIVISLLKGFPLDRINECANRVASYVCSRQGATPPLPEEIRKLFST